MSPCRQRRPDVVVTGPRRRLLDRRGRRRVLRRPARARASGIADGVGAVRGVRPRGRDDAEGGAARGPLHAASPSPPPTQAAAEAGLPDGDRARARSACIDRHRRRRAEDAAGASASAWLEERRARGVAALRADDDAQRRRRRRSPCASARTARASAVASACATGGHAIGEAARMIERGEADVVVAGGTEAALTGALPGRLQAHGRAVARGRLAPVRRPPRRLRHGRGRGRARARARRARARRAARRCYARVAGYGASNDAFHITQPDEDGRGAIAGDARGAARRRARPGRRRLHQRARHARRRSTTAIETHGDPRGLQRRHAAAGLLDEVGDRPPARRRRRGRGASRCVEARAPRRAAADAELRGARPRVRPRLRARRARARRRASSSPCRNSFGFGGQNAPRLASGERAP